MSTLPKDPRERREGFMEAFKFKIPEVSSWNCRPRDDEKE
jgi:hypothetical protein